VFGPERSRDIAIHVGDNGIGRANGCKYLATDTRRETDRVCAVRHLHVCISNGTLAATRSSHIKQWVLVGPLKSMGPSGSIELGDNQLLQTK
jgi:hypothetical protein